MTLPPGRDPGMTLLPGWLDALLSASEQRALDAWAIGELGIPGWQLMERAGAGLARVAADLAPDGPITLVCGKGNNGGDGFVAARVLREHGREVRVLTLADRDELRGDAAAAFDRLTGPPAQRFSPTGLEGAGTIVDAILGTGFSGTPHGAAVQAIEAINAVGVPVLACDVPSGVDASSGEVAGAAIRAAATATFHAGKPGLWISPGKGLAGEVHVIDIGIPPGGPVHPTIGLIDPAVLDEIPRRGRESTKFAAGSVLVCGGSLGLTGAPCMSCEAAMRAGAGYVTAFVPASLNLVFESRLLEVMTVPLPDEDGALTRAGADHVLERTERAGALVLGPGLGRRPEAFELARTLAARASLPLLLDADGLNAHAGVPATLAARRAPTVLTPHAGELARLLEADSSDVSASRLGSVRRAARVANAVVVLKGDDTLVATPQGMVAVSPGGAPALATAGTGDVLSGVIGCFMSKGLDAFVAASAGVLTHVRAGQRAASARGPEGVLARDVIEALPHALRPAS